MTDAELLSVILRIDREAAESIISVNGLAAIMQLDHNTAVKGITPGKVKQLACIAELSRRISTSRYTNQRACFSDPYTIANFYMEGMACVSYAESTEKKDYSISGASWDNEETQIIAIWDEAESKTSYKLQLYKGSKKLGNSVNTSRAEYDFTNKIKTSGSGTYYFTVRPTKGTSDMMLTSEKLSVTSSMVSDLETTENNNPTSANSKTDTDKGPGATESSKNSGSGTWKWEYDGWHYIVNNANMRSCWILDNSCWYHINAAGIMEKGIINDNNETYYLGDSGAMATGWLQIDGKWYFFNTGDPASTGHPNGAMLNDTITPDGYNVGNDGVWIR